MVLQAPTIELNPGFAPSVDIPDPLIEYTMPNSEFAANSGWQVSADGITSIVTRAPSHEPWPYHNQGVQNNVSLSTGSNTIPPGAPTIPAGTTITKIANAVLPGSQALQLLGGALSSKINLLTSLTNKR